MTLAAFRLSHFAATSLIAAALSTMAGVAVADTGHGSADVGKPAKESAAQRTLEVILAENFYEPERIEVKAGETVRFVLRNTGELLHEFNIGTAEMHAAHQKEMAEMVEHGMLTATGVDEKMMKMDHSGMPGAGAVKHDDPNSVLVPPGETRELVWTFGKEAEIEFACNLPGHYEAGMVGDVVFKP